MVILSPIQEIPRLRRSREYREAHPFTGSPKAAERKVEYAYSTKEWAEKSGNNYIEMRT